MASTFHRLKILDVQQETPECISVSFDVPAVLGPTFRYTAGQYLTLRAHIDGEEVRRAYSICTSPHENDLRVAIKRVPDGRFSSFAHEVFRMGETIDVMPPAGRFFTPLDPDQARHYLAVAAGSGITPVIALIKATLREEPESRFTLLYGNKDRNTVIFKNVLADLKNVFVDRLGIYHIFSRESLDTPLLEGRIDAEKLERFFSGVIQQKQVDEVFLCGPEAMTLALRTYLLEAGFDQKQIHMELFGTAKTAEKERVWGNEQATEVENTYCKVTVKVDGAALEVALRQDGESILDAALQAGADLPYACKGGVCTTCKARLESGAIEMDVNYGLEQDEVAAGLILTCQAHPKTPEVVVNYDVR